MPNFNISFHGGRSCRGCMWLSDLAKHFNIDYLEVSTHAVVALDDHGHLAGIWKYNKTGYHIKSVGTYVHPKHRKLGLAKKLWSQVLENYDIRSVKVIAMTDKGFSLSSSVKEDFPKISWNIVKCGDRDLRRISISGNK